MWCQNRTQSMCGESSCYVCQAIRWFNYNLFFFWESISVQFPLSFYWILQWLRVDLGQSCFWLWDCFFFNCVLNGFFFPVVCCSKIPWCNYYLWGSRFSTSISWPWVVLAIFTAILYFASCGAEVNGFFLCWIMATHVRGMEAARSDLERFSLANVRSWKGGERTS